MKSFCKELQKKVGVRPSTCTYLSLCVSVLLKPTISETGVKLPLRKKRRVNREPTRVAGRDRA